MAIGPGYEDPRYRQRGGGTQNQTGGGYRSEPVPSRGRRPRGPSAPRRAEGGNDREVATAKRGRTPILRKGPAGTEQPRLPQGGRTFEDRSGRQPTPQEIFEFTQNRGGMQPPGRGGMGGYPPMKPPQGGYNGPAPPMGGDRAPENNPGGFGGWKPGEVRSMPMPGKIGGGYPAPAPGGGRLGGGGFMPPRPAPIQNLGGTGNFGPPPQQGPPGNQMNWDQPRQLDPSLATRLGGGMNPGPGPMAPPKPAGGIDTGMPPAPGGGMTQLGGGMPQQAISQAQMQPGGGFGGAPPQMGEDKGQMMQQIAADPRVQQLGIPPDQLQKMMAVRMAQAPPQAPQVPPAAPYGY